MTPDQKDYIERIRIGGEALLALINDILDFSKVEKKKVKLEHQPLSLRHWSKSPWTWWQSQASREGLEPGLHHQLRHA